MTVQVIQFGKVLFSPGRYVATPGALDLISGSDTAALELLNRHVSGDWGDLCDEDKAQNNRALKDGSRLMSQYHVNGKKIWVITDGVFGNEPTKREVTTLLLPEEY